MAIRAVWASGAARALSGGVAVVLTLLLSGCPEAVTGPDKATRLLFTIQPTSTVAGLPITPAVTAKVALVVLDRPVAAAEKE